MNNAIKLTLSAALAAFAAYFNILFIPLCVLVIVMSADYITGIASAFVKREISSRAGLVGIIKKLGYIFAVGVGMTVDYICHGALATVGQGGINMFFFGMLVTIWLILNELTSILENLDELGVPLPAFLKKIILKLRKSVENKGDGDDDGE